MSLELASVNAKLGRAEEHRGTLYDEISHWYKAPPYRAVPETNADFTKHSVWIERTKTPEPNIERWSLIFGDAVHNLRAVLDHLIYAVAIHQTGRNPPPGERALAFIIERSVDDFAAKRSRMKPNALSSSVWAAIEGVQPFNRKHNILPPLLQLIADLDNMDKHRLPHGFMATPTEIDVTLEGSVSPGIYKTGQGGFFGELKHRTEVMWVSFNGPAPDMKYRINLVETVFAIAHGKREVTDEDWKGRTEASALLTEMIAEVKAIIPLIVGAV